MLISQTAAGRLGIIAENVESRMSIHFELAARWKAAMLIDEADVFLAQRSLEYPTHNALVTVFLRQLEYYQGILFLTTNRAKTFDESIESRIHVAIHYGALDVDARREVFRSLLAKASTKKGGAEYSPKGLQNLAKEELNGREVSRLH